MIAGAAVAKAAPDGYTIGMVTVSSHGINPTLYGDLMRYDAVKDFAPIILAAETKNVVVVHPSIPVKNVPELIAYAKANPDKLSFGSAGTGTTQHLAGEMVKIMTGVKMQHVPYRGAAAAVPDLLTGQTQLMFVTIPDVISHIQAGSLRPIGITSKERSRSLPDVVPMAEQGWPISTCAAGSAWWRLRARPKPSSINTMRRSRPCWRATTRRPSSSPWASTP